VKAHTTWLLRLMPVIILMVLALPLAFGQTADISEPSTIFSLPIQGIAYGLLIGLLYATVGYAATDPEEEFQAVKFFSVLVISALVGVVAGLLNVSFEQAEALLAMFGVIALLQKLYNVAIRRLFPNIGAFTSRARQASG